MQREHRAKRKRSHARNSRCALIAQQKTILYIASLHPCTSAAQGRKVGCAHSQIKPEGHTLSITRAKRLVFVACTSQGITLPSVQSCSSSGWAQDLAQCRDWLPQKLAQLLLPSCSTSLQLTSHKHASLDIFSVHCILEDIELISNS